jgi:hypothetical protein
MARNPYPALNCSIPWIQNPRSRSNTRNGTPRSNPTRSWSDQRLRSNLWHKQIRSAHMGISGPEHPRPRILTEPVGSHIYGHTTIFHLTTPKQRRQIPGGGKPARARLRANPTAQPKSKPLHALRMTW